VEKLGGTLKAVEENFQQQELADFAYGIAQRKQSGEHVVVGVNKYRDEGTEQPIEIHRNDPESEQRQIESLQRLRATRDHARLEAVMARLREVVRDRSANVMPATIEAVKAGATMGEIVAAVREVLGTYVEKPVF
jgi:methylmalonyl-CoA mutase N-terminal domain/subunit